jgi:HicA-like toxin of HicAB toxin-antitoxin system
MNQHRADLRRAGFSVDHQRGSHQVWKHPLIPGVSANLVGADGTDAKPYQEQEVRTALQRLEEARRNQP